MKYFIILIAFIFASCGINNTDDKSIQATVYMESPATTPYNMFTVMESDDFDKPEINIHYENYIEQNPNKKSIIETDTINVLVEKYTSRFKSVRYRLIKLND